jgi:hypothetical protein
LHSITMHQIDVCPGNGGTAQIQHCACNAG